MDNYNIIGKSEKIREVLEVAERIALSDASVLIYGESGTGKELFARFIYNKSNRKDKKFVALNCAAIPGELLENELFGHIKGAYTDAIDDYTGKFGYADGGIIFLDEIGELSLNLQAKILRVLQFKEYEPIGSNKLLQTDVRIIAATNKNILELIKENKFREDLYYRLNVVPIIIPPLRERKTDIEILAKYFLDIFNNKNKKNIIDFSITALNILNEYDWPGNVRELQNVVERAIVLCKENYIQKEDIALYKDFKKENNNTVKSLKDAINDFKKQYIIEILEKNQWNQTITAKQLEIQRTYLSRLVKELEIDKI